MAIMNIESYRVRPAENGWTLDFTDRNTGREHSFIFKTSKELAAFFVKLDEGRIKANKAAGSH